MKICQDNHLSHLRQKSYFTTKSVGHLSETRIDILYYTAPLIPF